MAERKQKPKAVLPPAPMMDGKHGGKLRRGNPGNRGRTASMIRQGVLADAPAAHAFLRQVMDGAPTIPATSYCNTCDQETMGKVAAEITDRLSAAREILKYGLGPAGSAADVESLAARVRGTLAEQLDILDRLLASQPDLHREVMLQLSGLWAKLEGSP